MSDEIKDVNAKIDEAEAAVKKYASKDTVISIGGYEFTPAKLMVAFTIVSSTLGGLYGAFEVYKDYTGMKKKIAEYVAPDLSDLNKKIELTMQASEKSAQYTQDIKNDLKQDIRRVENVAENVERSSKQSARESDLAVKEVRDELRQTRKEVDGSIKSVERNVDSSLKNMERSIDSKIQKALDNPLNK
jgi:predicted DNA-binding ArsR family transcriptional regulator